MARKLLIVDSGRIGRSCLDIAAGSKQFEEIAFLDENWMTREVNGYKVVGGFSDLGKLRNDYTDVCIAVELNEYRHRLLRYAKRLGYRLPILVSKRSNVSPKASVGVGTIILPNVAIEPNAMLGDGCIICSNSVIYSDAYLDDCVLIDANTVIKSRTRIDKNAKVGCTCIISFAKSVEENLEVPDGTIF